MRQAARKSIGQALAELTAEFPDEDIKESKLRFLEAEGLVDVELSLAFVDDDEIAELHERYMDEPGPTDVLTFPLDGEHDVDESGVRMLGDVVIAPLVAARNNPDDAASELRLLVVHGVLHALGYDHEEDADRVEMWARQERYSGVTVP